MNVTFDRKELLGGFHFLNKVKNPRASSVRITAIGDRLTCRSGVAAITVNAMVLEPGAFTTKRAGFQAVLGSFPDETLMLQADAERFRIGSFSAQHTEYEANPKEEAS